MSSFRNNGDPATVMEPKLLNRGIKQPHPSTPKEVPAGTQQLAVPIMSTDSNEDDIPATQPNSPQLVTSVRKDIENLQSAEEFCEHFVTELRKFNAGAEMLIPQLKYLQCHLSQLLDFLNCTMMRQTELFATKDLAAHLLLACYRQKRKAYKRCSMRRKNS